MACSLAISFKSDTVFVLYGMIFMYFVFLRLLFPTYYAGNKNALTVMLYILNNEQKDDLDTR